MTPAQSMNPFNQPCHYCGEVVTGRQLQRDHFIPKFSGGTNDLENLVYACNTCNVIKGPRPIKTARPNLLQKKYGWPKFSPQQLCWLRERGFDLSDLDNGKLHFETIRE
jgi:5-methylcytosine-specific restriction endonuclease McrA